MHYGLSMYMIVQDLVSYSTNNTHAALPQATPTYMYFLNVALKN